MWSLPQHREGPDWNVLHSDRALSPNQPFNSEVKSDLVRPVALKRDCRHKCRASFSIQTTYGRSFTELVLICLCIFAGLIDSD